LESCSSRGSITISDVIEYLYCPRFTYFNFLKLFGYAFCDE